MIKRINYLLLLLVILIPWSCTSEPGAISLAGEWEFAIDSLDTGIYENPVKAEMVETVRLPGSMTENNKGNEVTLHTPWTGSIYDSSWYFLPEMEKYRQPGNLMFPFWLTPVKHYVGPAWYRKEIHIPDNWKDQRIVLFLERVHTESRLWIDSIEAGMNNSLVTPHEFDLSGILTPGKHSVILRIDNRIKEINVGPDSHSITDHTQGNWNGVIGRMELRRTPMIWIDEVQVYPDLEIKTARIKILIRNRTGKESDIRLALDAKSYNSIRVHNPGKIVIRKRIKDGDNWIEIEYPLGERMLTWDEFSPALYRLLVRMQAKSGWNQKTVQFGMREFSAEGTRFTVNGRPVFLRGNCDCAIFPLTGYPPMDVYSWTRIFNILKDYGFNHVRYHSWCPPRAAFIAADRAGFYLQPEGPSWANHGTAIGYGRPVDRYIYEETDRMVKYYGNYASFVMMAYGNEPAGRNQATWLGEFVKYWHDKDPRRLYTGASVGKSWPWVPEAEYIVKSYPRGLPWERPPQTMFDFHRQISAQSVPYVAHESGQYCAFPNFNEIEKYTGVLKPRNFELFLDLLKEHDMADQAEEFLYASGRLQLLCYKHEIEAALRTPGFAGFQLLQLNDFPGQGTALVGVLDAFFESKGYTGPEEFRQFCNSTVLLARIPKFVYINSESFRAGLEVSHFGRSPLEDKVIRWEITSEDREIHKTMSYRIEQVPVDNAFHLADIDLPLGKIPAPVKLTLKVSIKDTQIFNEWDFWVYPDSLPDIPAEDVYFTNELDDRAITTLKSGGSVFLFAAGKIEKGKDVAMQFKPVFWNTSWFQMRPPHTTGILCKSDHPALSEFPNDGYSDLQWWEILHRQQVMNLDNYPKGFRPIIQPIDTWFLSRKLGVLFEARIGPGKILVTSIDFERNIKNRPAARQLLYSLEKYIHSDRFNPKFEVDLETIRELMVQPDTPGEGATFNAFTRSSTDDLKPSL